MMIIKNLCKMGMLIYYVKVFKGFITLHNFFVSGIFWFPNL